MKISVVIPTLNEEKTLPQLLKSLRAQDFTDYEIIIADAGSADKTREVAKNFSCRIVKGGLPGAGRNAGAAAAKGDFLFFLDADVVLPPHFLRDTYAEMQERYLDLATCAIKPISDYKLDQVIHRMINLAILLNLRFDPKAFGFCIFVTKRLFERVGGFDETIYFAEDNDFVKRAAVLSPLRYLNSTFVKVSVRRFEKEGRFAYVNKGIKVAIYRTFNGEIRDDKVIKYEFAAFDKSESQEDLDFLRKLEKQLIKIEESARDLNQRVKKKSREISTKQIQPRVKEYKNLVKELGGHLSKKSRRQK